MSEKANHSRRSFLRRGLDLATLAFLGAGLYPVLSFVGFRLPRKPVRVVINKRIPVGGFWLEHNFVLFVREGRQWAVSRKCTHLGCRLNINESAGKLICPCHQSKFDFDGRRLAGPAKLDLPTYPVEKGKEGYVVIM